MAQHKRYWSCTKFADWVRGTAKPTAETSEGWGKWKKKAKNAHKFRYWIAEELLDNIQDVVTWPIRKIYDVKYYVNNRWVTKTHALTSSPKDIPRGEWRDVGNRFLPCLFNELVDYVEVELAWSNIAWSEESRKKYNPPFYAWGWFRWRTWRCPEAGLDYLNWAKDLTNEEWLEEDQKHTAELTPQAISSREILELYNWWKNIYPNRPDPMDASGWTDFCEKRRQRIKTAEPEMADDILYGIETQSDKERKESSRILDLCHKIEQDQENEDTDMLVRLIKIRQSLWT